MPIPYLAIAAVLAFAAPLAVPLLGSAPASTGVTKGVREAVRKLREGGWDGKRRAIVVDIPNQRLLVMKDGRPENAWRVSTSKYGVGTQPRSYKTPPGLHRIWQKSGARAKLGQPLSGGEPSDRATPEELSSGKVFITTRALKLDGLEESNRTSRSRGIWIHGTSAENRIGRPASIGCVRMRAVDVVTLFDMVDEGTLVFLSDLK